VITRVSNQLRREARDLALKFCCEDCAHFAEDRAACGNGYPVEPHRGVRLELVGEMAFCKDFELA
jgi:hypothetical protein